MNRLAITLTAVLAGVLATSASADPPPTALAHFAMTHTRPVAGRTFTGVTVTPAAESIWYVTCDATLRGTTLHGRVRMFYADDVPGGPAAVTCSWRIPAKARGLLQATVIDWTKTGQQGGGGLSWRIRR